MRDGLGGMQSVLLLGGGSDIGAATIDRLIANRCRTVILAARRPDELAGLVERFRTAGAERVETVAFDGADPESHELVLGAIFDEHPQIDLVISAFGVLGDQEHFDHHPAEAAEAVAVNFGGQVSALLVVADRLTKQGQGTIVVLSSVAGERVRASNVTYGATKAGLDAFAQGLGDRLVGTGVRVMVVRPGFVRTKMTEGMDAAPFATTPDAVADDIVAGLTKGSAIVWSPAILRWFFTVMRHLPRPIWRKVAARG
jgi:decaprenylphospho-beta-D-erythro-pentofuranosid-2-ulose 2-reductase